jgi:DNA repair ATPase RecN
MCAESIPSTLRTLALAELQDMKDEEDFVFRAKVADAVKAFKEALDMLNYGKETLSTIPRDTVRMTYASPAPQLAQAKNICERAKIQLEECITTLDDLQSHIDESKRRFEKICDIIEKEYGYDREKTATMFQGLDFAYSMQDSDVLERFAAMQLRRKDQ